MCFQRLILELVVRIVIPRVIPERLQRRLLYLLAPLLELLVNRFEVLEPPWQHNGVLESLR